MNTAKKLAVVFITAFELAGCTNNTSETGKESFTDHPILNDTINATYNYTNFNNFNNDYESIKERTNLKFIAFDLDKIEGSNQQFVFRGIREYNHEEIDAPTTKISTAEVSFSFGSYMEGYKDTEFSFSVKYTVPITFDTSKEYKLIYRQSETTTTYNLALEEIDNSLSYIKIGIIRIGADLTEEEVISYKQMLEDNIKYLE